MRHETLHRQSNSFYSYEERMHNTLQDLACRADSLTKTLANDPDESVREFYRPLIKSCANAVATAFDVLEQ